MKLKTEIYQPKFKSIGDILRMAEATWFVLFKKGKR